jgi:hypothetical protein
MKIDGRVLGVVESTRTMVWLQQRFGSCWYGPGANGPLWFRKDPPLTWLPELPG